MVKLHKKYIFDVISEVPISAQFIVAISESTIYATQNFQRMLDIALLIITHALSYIDRTVTFT